MKLRSLLLLTCMVVMPVLAMFSHLIPTAVRAATRRHVASLAASWFGTSAEAGPPTAEEPAAPMAAAGASRPADLLAVAASVPPVAEATALVRPPAAPDPARQSAESPATAVSLDGFPAAVNASPVTEGGVTAATPALVAQWADRTRQAREHQSREIQAIEARLRDLGAVAFDCQSLPGSEGLHSSGCRVPVDASGQLQRVFQATDHDPVVAATAVLAQVTAWRQRITQPVAGTPAAASPSASPPVGAIRSGTN